MIYLASPYSDPDEKVRIQRFDAVCEKAAELLRAGHIIFSPIAHCHPIARFGLPTNWGFWECFDKVYLNFCEEMWILTLPGWRESKGIQAEIKIMKSLVKPIRFIYEDGKITITEPK